MTSRGGGGGGGGLMLPELPTDIVFEILLKLSIETLSVCREVSKSWYHTIRQPRFIKSYNSKVIHNSNSPSVISQAEFLDVSFHLLDHDDTSLAFYTRKSEPISQLYSCNGWVLSVSGQKEPYFICNPMTGEHLVVPKSPINAYGVITGFGWDPISNVFKIIRISDDCTHKLYFGTYLEVFNFSTEEWRVAKWTGRQNDEEPCRASSIFRFSHRPNTFLNGFLHWIEYPYHGSMTIISFNLHTEEFKQVPMPPGLDMDPVELRPQFFFLGVGIPSDLRSFQHYLVVLGECLSIVHNFDYHHVEIWVMKEYGLQSSWSKEYIIRNIVMDGIHPIKGPYKPIQLMRNGEILLLCSEQTLGYYHPVTKAFWSIDAGDVLYHSSISQPSLHVDSLIYLAKKNRDIAI